MGKRIVVKSTEEWLDLRKKVITATESASLVGANPWRSMQKCWDEKMFSEFKGNAYTRAGQLLEPVVVEATNIALGRNFKLYEEKKDEKVFYIDEGCGLGATPDAHENNILLLECKTTKPANKIKYGFTPPPYYVVQLQTQFHCTGAHTGYLSIMSTDLSPEDADSELPIVIFQVDKDEKICDHLCNESKRFWECQNAGKKFRVDSAIKKEVALRLTLCYKRVY